MISSRRRRIKESKQLQNNEFYTLYEDIAAELPNYKEFLKGKRIICPCDCDEFTKAQIVYSNGKIISFNNTLIKSNFIKYLIKHAKEYKIKSISVSGFDPNTNKGIRFQDLDYSKYDIVITNPPFSQFREFVEILLKNKMQFLVIGPQNALTYKDFFQHIQNNEIWIGYHFHMSGFALPNGTIIGRRDNRARSCCWYTNLEVQTRHEEIVLTAKYSPEKYPSYYNFDGIDIKDSRKIPCDYDGYMGVPITFMQKYNPDQFELIGLGSPIEKKFIHKKDGAQIHYIDKKTNEIVYSFPFSLRERKIGNLLRVQNKDGTPGNAPFGRIIIRNKKVNKE